jgi:hypothetical protein
MGHRIMSVTDVEFVLSREQRDDIMKAVKAIERQVKEIADKSHWQALYVISTNLTIIQASVTNLPRATAN